MGFGTYKTSELTALLDQAIPLSGDDINGAALTLECYKAKDYKSLTEYLKLDHLSAKTKQILRTELLRLPNKEGHIALEKEVQEIKEEAFGDFGVGFRLFTKKYAELGLGDLQFQKLWNAS